MIAIRGGLCLLLMLAAACGQRGPLYLPDKATEKVEVPAPSAPQDPQETSRPDSLAQGESAQDGKEEPKKKDE